MPKNSKSSTPAGPVVSLRSTPEDATARPEEITNRSGDFENLGELPRSYGDDSIFLIAQEPHWLFCYWDLDISNHPGGAAHLRYTRASGEREGEIEVPFETRNWYIPVSHADSEYYVEIGFYRGDQWKSIARSVTVKTPPEGMSQSDDFAFATVPFHLSFQRLVDNLENAFQGGEDLVEAVARMQKRGDFSAFGVPDSGDLSTLNPLALLAAVAGPEFLAELSSSSLGSEELHSRVQAHLAGRISSDAGASFTSGSAESFSSTDLASGSFASELLATFSSWSPEEVSSWLQAAAQSWTSAAGGESSFENLGSGTEWSSFGAPTSWTKEALASWLTGIESSGSTLSSWLQSSESSGFPVALSSWLQGVQSSWSEAATSSWAQTGSASWDSGADSSWGSSETSSWGGSDVVSSFSSPVSGRDFHLNVNAEVIFYGGTDPQAAVTIDGKPVELNPEGTFRYHFVFPNDIYEIPIVATSPDGVETRSAVLNFARGTQKTGHVTDTPQPLFPAPIGRQ